MDEERYPWRHALVVGASSGIGEAVARLLLAQGISAALVARRVDRLQALRTEFSGRANVPIYGHDVRDTATVADLFQEVATDLGGLDLVVYASGIMPNVGEEEYPTIEDLATIETNLSGAVAWLNQAAVRFGRLGGGTIIGISSVAGDRGRRGNPVYGATKAALDMYLASLRVRLANRGVTVLTAKPGYVRTALIADLRLPPFPVVSAQDAASAILNAAIKGRRVVYVPWWWRIIMLAVRAIPTPIFERLSF